MGVISIKANLVVAAIDGYTGSSNIKGALQVMDHNGKIASKKGDGCFVFVNMKPGRYKITVQGAYYCTREFDVEIGEQVITEYVTMMPSRHYPNVLSATRLHGKASKSAYVIFESGDKNRILRAYDKGAETLQIYMKDAGEIVGREFMISQGKKSGVYRVLKADSQDMKYQLNKPLQFAVDSEAKIMPVYEITPDDGGQYFLAVRGEYQKATLVFEKSKKEIEIGKDTEYDF